MPICLNRISFKSSLQKGSFLLVVLFCLTILLGTFSTAATGFAACEYLSSSDFGSGSGWTAKQETATWKNSSGILNVQDIKSGYASYALHDFAPSGYFSLDSKIEIVSTTDEWDAVGIYFYLSGDVYFSANGYMTNRIAAFYYPTKNQVKFWVWDLTNEEWVFPLGFQPVSGTVTDIGLSMVADGVIMRLNRQDTNLKLSGNFSGAPYAVNEVRLWGQGTGLHARFDNVCASAYEVNDFPPGNTMPVPFQGGVLLSPAPTAAPIVNIDPATAIPLGFGAAASGGSILSLTAGLSGLNAPADLYVGIQMDQEIYFFDGVNGLHALSSEGLVPWRTNTTGGLQNVRLLPDIDLSAYPGTYNFYFLMTPAGRLDTYRLWTIPVSIGDGGASPITDHTMETEIKQNIDLIFGITSGFSGGLPEVMTVFKDKNVVTINPSLESTMDAVFAGTPIPRTTITVNFGSGHTLASGAVMSGNAQIILSNIKFTVQKTGADFSGTFNNIMKDGAPFASGTISGQILMTKISDDLFGVSGQINVNNLSINGQPMSGTIGISGNIGTLDFDALMNMDLAKLLKTTGDITLSFTNFISGAYTINSGTVHIINPQNGNSTISTDLQTSQGRVILNMTSAVTATSAVINTTAPGTVGPYTLSINNVSFDQDICANYPTAGTMSFTNGTTGKTGLVTFNGSCNGTYGYSER